MKKGITLGSLLIVIILAMAPTSSDAFNPLAHIYIAENACPDCIPKIDYFYGSIVPDLAWSVTNPDEDWINVVDDTHYRDIRRFAWGTTQEAFAAGWLTHSEAVGADYYAHFPYTTDCSDPDKGYVIEKSCQLIKVLGWSENTDNLAFAHYIIEATIDLLLKYNDDDSLPGKLLFANLFRSWEDRNLMMRVFVWRWWEKSTDWKTLAGAEFAFRQLISKYAAALILPWPHDEMALAELGAALAWERYGLVIDPYELKDDILPKAIKVCEGDYYDVIEEAIEAVGSP